MTAREIVTAAIGAAVLIIGAWLFLVLLFTFGG